MLIFFYNKGSTEDKRNDWFSKPNTDKILEAKQSSYKFLLLQKKKNSPILYLIMRVQEFTNQILYSQLSFLHHFKHVGKIIHKRIYEV